MIKNSTGLPSSRSAPGKPEHSTHRAWVFALLLFPVISPAQVFKACGVNQQAALIKAESSIVEAQGAREVSGHEELNQTQYQESIEEENYLVTEHPVKLQKVFIENRQVCVEVER